MSRLQLLKSAFALAVSLSAAVLGPAPRADAQDPCDDSAGRGPIEVTPASGAAGVTIDSPVRVRYSPGYLVTVVAPRDLIEIRDIAGDELRGSVEVIGDVLVFLPATLEPVTAYEGVARGLDFDLDFSFRTSVSVDVAPPRLGNITETSSAAVDEDCAAPDGGFRVDVSFDPATDDGSPGSIEYLLYQTRGATLEAPVLRARTRNFTTELITMAFVLRGEEAVDPICVVVHAVDGLGNVDDDQEPVCFDPVEGNYFAPFCAASPSRRQGFPFAFLTGALVVAGLSRRRRR